MILILEQCARVTHKCVIGSDFKAGKFWDLIKLAAIKITFSSIIFPEFSFPI